MFTSIDGLGVLLNTKVLAKTTSYVQLQDMYRTRLPFSSMKGELSCERGTTTCLFPTKSCLHPYPSHRPQQRNPIVVLEIVVAVVGLLMMMMKMSM